MHERLKNKKSRVSYKNPASFLANGKAVDGATVAPAATSAFFLRENGSIEEADESAPQVDEPRITLASPPRLIHGDDSRGLWLYHGNCLDLLDIIATKYPEGRFDMIFADPPYFLSNGGITCHAGRMVKVDKGNWD